MNIAFVSHCNFLGNSAMHLFSIAEQLQKMDHDCVVLVPRQPETVFQHGTPHFRAMDYADATAGGLGFRNGAGPDITHAWTPRENVRITTEQLVEKYRCVYLVHMEDNEEQIVSAELSFLTYKELAALPEETAVECVASSKYRSIPQRSHKFIRNSRGYTCLIDRLLEFKPAYLPGLVFWPGFEPEFVDVEQHAAATRLRYNIAGTDIVLLYAGGAHAAVAADLRRLYLAVGLLRRRGYPIKLVRTGVDHVAIGLDERHGLDRFIVSLGFLPRHELPMLVGMADILVQPGRSDAFNDYRFPSKLPEYLVSGRPVVLPNSNIGKVLRDGDQAIILREGSVAEMSAAIERLMLDRELGRRLGENGRKFALEHLSWEKAARQLHDFYQTISGEGLGRSGSLPSQPDSAGDRDQSDRDGRVESPAAAASFPAKLIAFYLPQFHPIPENSQWWGEGFTEWTNVARAKPLFDGHRQPRVPTDLGFYDLRVGEVMHQQAALARKHGLFGFCFYYYWFSGRRLLERPLTYWLSDAGPDFPFCVCWANENWSRRWDGSDAEVLVQQSYSPDNDRRFFADILPIIRHPRYISAGGRPMLLVYRVSELPDPVGTAATWRRMAAEAGLPGLFLVAVQSFNIRDPRPFGFDAAVQFMHAHIDRALVDLAKMKDVGPNFKASIEDYVAAALQNINSPAVDYARFGCAFPSWDNTPRRGRRGHVFVNDSPKAYAQWLRFLVREALERRDRQDPLVFINAWNEWGEGAYLEPDDDFGRARLEVTYAALCEGVIDYERGLTPNRERIFTDNVSRLPLSRMTTARVPS